MTTTLNLRTIKLRSGEQFRDEREIRLEPLELGGQRYLPVPENVPAELAITRALRVFPAELDLHLRAQRCTGHGRAVLPIP